MATPHDSHPDILKRLKRAAGHLDHVIEMIEDESPCLKTAQQLQAVISALENAKSMMALDHVENCLMTSLEEKPTPMKQKKILEELREMSKYL